MHHNRLLIKPVVNNTGTSLRLFSDVPLRYVFWDPFANRTFVKVSDSEAGCLAFPESYTQQFVPFDSAEEVYIIGPKPKSQIALMTHRQKSLIKSYKHRRNCK